MSLLNHPFVLQLKTRLKGQWLFGWRLTEIGSLISFALRRIRQGQLVQVSGSLTFTTVLALVPILTIALAIFTVFPLFTTFRASLEAYFIQSLMPKAISTNILSYLNQFATKATRLSAYGAVALMVTSLAMLATIDKVFNEIWRVKQKRPLLKRMMVYWALITLAPLLMGVSLTVTSYLFAATSDVVGTIPGSKALYSIASVVLTTCAYTLLYIAVPNRKVDWRDAAWGGLVAGILFEIAKRIFAAFVIHMPTYTIVYGAVALIPIFLIWIYTSWLITLFGAVIAASLPVVKYERWWHVPRPGSRFVDAIALLEVLLYARNRSNQAGLTSWEIREKTRLGFDEIESLLNQMTRAGWVGRVDADEFPRKKATPLLGSECWVLLANPGVLLISDVYRLFVFESQPDARLTKKVEEAIEQGLQETLEHYFLPKR
ncbi:membrane protein [Oxalobacteraceae bacterium GrIS 2.11]